MKGPGGTANEAKEGMLEYLEDIIGSSRFMPAIKRVSTLIEQLSHDKQVSSRVSSPKSRPH